MLAAVTMDGKIARHDHHGSTWTSREDKTHLHKILDGCDVLLVGRKTYETARKPLSQRRCWIFTHSPHSQSQKKSIGSPLFLSPRRQNLLHQLEKHQFYRVAILGGTSVYSWFLKNRLIDELYLTIEPIIFGQGLPLFQLKTHDQRFRLLSVKRLNRRGTILLRYARF